MSKRTINNAVPTTSPFMHPVCSSRLETETLATPLTQMLLTECPPYVCLWLKNNAQFTYIITQKPCLFTYLFIYQSLLNDVNI